MTVEVQQITAFSRFRMTWSRVSLTTGLLAIVIILGCGKTSSPMPTPAPNADTQNQASSESRPEPPGKMEMPANVLPTNVLPTNVLPTNVLPTNVLPTNEMPTAEVPTQSVPDTSTDSEPKARNGFELPKDVPLPQASSASPTIPSLEIASWEDIQRTAKSTKRVTVVDVWSLSCAPCLKEFPGLVRIHKRFGENVACIGVDIDYDGRKTRPPETYQARVTEFLTTVGAEFSNYISNTPSDDIYAAAAIDSIPAVLIYDANGDLVKTFADAGDTAGFTYDKDIIPLIEKLAG